MFTIRVIEPQSGRFVEWTSDNFYSLKNQAKIEREKGARVVIRNSDGKAIFKLPRSKKRAADRRLPSPIGRK